MQLLMHIPKSLTNGFLSIFRPVFENLIWLLFCHFYSTITENFELYVVTFSPFVEDFQITLEMFCVFYRIY